MAHTTNNRLHDNRDPGGVAGTAPESAPPPNRKLESHDTRKAAIVCVLLLLAVSLVFGQTIRHEFVNYDDGEYVYTNSQVKHGLTGNGILWAFTTTHVSNWHPLAWLSHMLDVELFGLHAGGHHLTSVVLHGAASVLLFLVLRGMTGSVWRSGFVAAVFAVHPLRAESVAWVAERKDVLSGLLFMLTLWAYAGYARRPFSWVRYLATAVLFALGLMAKPMLVTLPFVLLLLDFWPLGRMGPLPAGGPFPFPRRPVIEKLPLLALSAASSVATFFAQGEAVASIDAVPLVPRIANAFVSYMAYMGDLFYPVGLAVFYPFPETALPVWKVSASALGFAAISAAALTWRQRFPYLFVGWFWYAGMLFPVIGLVQAGSHAMADRYTYLPQIGLCLCLAWGMAQLASPWRHRFRVLGAVPVLAMLALMGIAWQQTSHWKDSESLWSRALACTMRNAGAHYNLGNALASQGRVDAAIAHYQKALEIKPLSAAIHNSLAVALANRGQVDAAIAHYQEALEINPDYPEAHNNLGSALAGFGQVDAAIAHYRRALEIRPGFAAAHNNLGAALAGRGEIAASIAHYQKALEINPEDATAHFNLGCALAGGGQAEAAIAHYRRALEIRPDHPEAHNNLGTALAGRGEIDAAIAHYQKALEIRPGFAAARHNLDAALGRRGERSRSPRN